MALWEWKNLCEFFHLSLVFFDKSHNLRPFRVKNGHNESRAVDLKIQLLMFQKNLQVLSMQISDRTEIQWQNLKNLFVLASDNILVALTKEICTGPSFDDLSIYIFFWIGVSDPYSSKSDVTLMLLPTEVKLCCILAIKNARIVLRAKPLGQFWVRHVYCFRVCAHSFQSFSCNYK